jgi:site-specific DNA recombinase
MKAVILARVSTREQEEGHSPEAQLHRLRDLAKSKEFDVIKEYQLVESASKDRRENFELMLDFVIKQKEIIAILVDTVDRITRNFKDAVMLDELRKEGKIEIHFYRENLIVHKDSNSAEILRWDMAIMFAKSYVLQLSDNIKRSQEQMIRSGQWPSKAPLGYKNVRLSEKQSEIQIDPLKADLIRKAFEWYSNGNYSISTLRKRLREAGLTPDTNLSQGSMHAILINPFYYGEMMWKTKLYPHKHPTLISKELYIQVQKIMENWNKKPFKWASKPFVFRGLIKCGSCGCMITGEKAKKKYVYYHCTNYHKKHNKSEVEWIKEENFIEQISDVLKGLRMPDYALKDLIEALRKSHEDESDYFKRNIVTLEQELGRIKTRLETMYEDKLEGRITNDMYDKKALEYIKKRDDIVIQIENHTKADSDYYIEAKKILDVSQRAYEIFKSSEDEEKRQFLTFMLQNSVLNERKLDVTLRKPFDDLLSCSQQQNWSGREDSNLRPHGPKPRALAN